MITQPFKLGTTKAAGKPTVASKSKLTRTIKGKAHPTESLARFGTYENLLEAGAVFRPKFSASGHNDLKLEFDPAVGYAKSLEVATEKLAAWLPPAKAKALKDRAGVDDLHKAARAYLQRLMESSIKP